MSVSIGHVSVASHAIFAERKHMKLAHLQCNVINYFNHYTDECNNYLNYYFNYCNIISHRLLTTSNSSQDKEIDCRNIELSLTIKTVLELLISNNKAKRIYKRLIVIDQIYKYCTICERTRENLHFLNKTHAYFTNISEARDYIFSCCNDCNKLIETQKKFLIPRNFNKLIVKKVSIMKKDVVKFCNKLKHKKLLEIYFVFTYKFGKDITQYIFTFIEKNIIYEHNSQV